MKTLTQKEKIDYLYNKKIEEENAKAFRVEMEIRRAAAEIEGLLVWFDSMKKYRFGRNKLNAKNDRGC